MHPRALPGAEPKGAAGDGQALEAPGPTPAPLRSRQLCRNQERLGVLRCGAQSRDLGGKARGPAPRDRINGTKARFSGGGRARVLPAGPRPREDRSWRSPSLRRDVTFLLPAGLYPATLLQTGGLSHGPVGSTQTGDAGGSAPEGKGGRAHVALRGTALSLFS